MSYYLLISLYFLILAQSISSMEHTSKEDRLPKITSNYYELSRTETNNSPPKKNHKKKFLNLLTQSDAEPHSSTTKISPRKLEIVRDNSKTSPEVSPRKPDNIGHNKNKISPRKLEVVENNSKTSPKSSPRKSDNIDYNKNKISPRKLEITEDNSKTSPKVSPRKFIKTMDNSDNIENIETKRSPLAKLPELPRSRSHSLHEDKHNIHNKPKRTVKSKSTNDKTALIYKTKSSKDLSFCTNDTITTGTYSPKEEECKNNNSAARPLSLSDSIIDNPMHPSQSNSSSSLCYNENNITITHSSSLI